MYSLENLKDIFGWLFSSPASIFVIGGVVFMFSFYVWLRRD